MSKHGVMGSMVGIVSFPIHMAIHPFIISKTDFIVEDKLEERVEV